MKNRIIEISRNKKLSHIGSCLSTVPILEDIYQRKAEGDLVILDNGHAHLAHLVAREKYEGLENIESLIDLDIHCNKEAGCDVATGSLGHGIGISLGLALANRERNVHCIVSDGGAMEGSFWEAIRIKQEMGVHNLKVYINANGFGAYKEINVGQLKYRIGEFDNSIRFYITSNQPMAEDLSAHYETI